MPKHVLPALLLVCGLWSTRTAADGLAFKVRSRSFQGADEIAISSVVESDLQQHQGSMEVRGRYRLTSKPEAVLELWCAGGEVKGDKFAIVKRGSGEFNFAFVVVKPGDLHLSYYPTEGGESFGSLYFDLEGQPKKPATLDARRGLDAQRALESRLEMELSKTEATPYFNLRYAPQSRDDAKKVRGFLEQAVANLRREFGAERADRLLKTASIDVYIHARAAQHAAEGLLTLQTGTQQGKYFAKIHLLAPSAHSTASRTSVGEPMDDNYIFKNLVHEYSTILLDRITAEKPRGWAFYNAPDWFVQGYPEYLGLMHSSEHSRKVSFEKYRHEHRSARTRMKQDFEKANAYIDGPVLLEFLHANYGKQKVQSLLSSEAEDFWAAVSAVLGENRESLHQAWSTWVNQL